MYYDPLALYRTAGDGCDCETPPMGEDDGNQNGGGENNGNEPSIPDPLPPFEPLPPNGDNVPDDETLPDNGTNGDTGNLPADAIDPRLLSLAMGFVPYQSWETPYAVDVGLSRGTIFPSLDKPFLGEPPISDTPTLRWGR